MIVPKLRYNGFSDEWQEVCLGEVGAFKSGGVDKKIYPGQQMINLLNYMDVYNRKHITSINCGNLMQVSASDKQIKECNITFIIFKSYLLFIIQHLTHLSIIQKPVSEYSVA